jgi:hypothetical protein
MADFQTNYSILLDFTIKPNTSFPPVARRHEASDRGEKSLIYWKTLASCPVACKRLS